MQRFLTAIYQKAEGEAKEQYRVLNFLELLAFINLFVFYSVYNVNVGYGADAQWQFSEVYALWQKYTIWSLVVICGMTFTQVSNVLLKGVTFLGIGLVVTLASSVLLPEQTIYFGIFTFLGMAMLLVQAMHSWLKKAPGSCGWLLSAIAYDLTRHLTDGVIIWQGKVIGHVPQLLYTKATTWLGFPAAGFSSMEYVPFLPNIFLFICGVYFFQFLTEHERGQQYLAKLR